MAGSEGRLNITLMNILRNGVNGTNITMKHVTDTTLPPHGGEKKLPWEKSPKHPLPGG